MFYDVNENGMEVAGGIEGVERELADVAGKEESKAHEFSIEMNRQISFALTGNLPGVAPTTMSTSQTPNRNVLGGAVRIGYGVGEVILGVYDAGLVESEFGPTTESFGPEGTLGEPRYGPNPNYDPAALQFGLHQAEDTIQNGINDINGGWREIFG
jgi:hypothetical protein